MKTSTYNQGKQLGFTIVELLIVIVVIAILAIIAIVAYNGVQERSRASVVASDIRQLDKAFRLLATSEGRTTWWLDTELPGGNNPPISVLITQTNLKDYFQKLSQATVDGTSNVQYDNDGDTYNGCNAGATGGVNIYFYNMTQSLAQRIDDAIDDGNIGCGSITYSSPNLRYNLSRTQNL